MLRAVGGLLLGGAAVAFSPAASGKSASVSVAAAANLVFAIDALHAAFKRAAPDVAVTVAIGASGSLFAQVRNGAPFDVFLSADTEYPGQLVAAGAGDATTLRTFASGRLVVWTRRPHLRLDDLAALARDPGVKKIAIAQPKTAPYGRAAQAALETLGVWGVAQPKIVLGESTSQTAQFAATGNADVGLVAMSIVLSPRLARQGRWHEVPLELYQSVPLDHAVVLTTRGAANPAARRYLDFLGSAEAREVLRTFGYGVPAP
jgi:molybdate transport system substrate-binding protein